MNEPDAPTPLNAQEVAGRQRTENRDSALFNSSLNRVNQSDQFGNTLNYSQSGTDANGNPTFSANQSLGATGQQYATGLSGLGQQYFSGAKDLLNNRPDLTSQGAFDNAYQTATANITPRFDRSRDQLDNRLRNQGLDPSSEAYRNAMNDSQLQQNEALNSLTTQLQGQMFNQGLQGRQQQVGELQSLTAPGIQAGNNFMNPGYAQTPLVNAGAVNIAGLEQNQFNQEYQGYQQEVGSRNAMLGGLAGLGGTALGAFFGGPAGAQIGGQIGGQAGSFL